MERFTRKMPGGYGLVEGKELGTVRNNRAVINRLAAYENCGFEPDEVMRIVLFAMEMSMIVADKKEAQNEASQH